MPQQGHLLGFHCIYQAIQCIDELEQSVRYSSNTIKGRMEILPREKKRKVEFVGFRHARFTSQDA